MHPDTTQSTHINPQPDTDARRAVLLAFYAHPEQAQAALDRLVALDAPLDRISVLGRASSSGDDPLGVYYPGVGDRMQGWGRLGALWGGIWGLVTGAAGIFLVPGLGPLAAAGPVVNALVGAAGGATLTGGVLAGAGAAAQLTVAVHRMGVPEERLTETRERLARGEQLILFIVPADEAEHWRVPLVEGGGTPVWDFPYVGLLEASGRAA